MAVERTRSNDRLVTWRRDAKSGVRTNRIAASPYSFTATSPGAACRCSRRTASPTVAPLPSWVSKPFRRSSNSPHGAATPSAAAPRSSSAVIASVVSGQRKTTRRSRHGRFVRLSNCAAPTPSSVSTCACATVSCANAVSSASMAKQKAWALIGARRLCTTATTSASANGAGGGVSGSTSLKSWRASAKCSPSEPLLPRLTASHAKASSGSSSCRLSVRVGLAARRAAS